MISFTGKATTKQFNKNKLNQVGLKNFALCGKSGRMIYFEIYQGAVEQAYQINRSIFERGRSAVMHLAQTIYSIQPKSQLLF